MLERFDSVWSSFPSDRMEEEYVLRTFHSKELEALIRKSGFDLVAVHRLPFVLSLCRDLQTSPLSVRNVFVVYDVK